MRIAATTFEGVFTIETKVHQDERGYFHRLYDSETFAAAGIDFVTHQSGVSHNLKRGTLRGMHYQKAPASQAKLVRCLTGSVYDVVIDLRPGSATYMRWLGFELSAENCLALFIPSGLAHGFISLSDRTDMLYELSAGERADCVGGVRWNDAAFGIAWPIAPIIMNQRDANWPDFKATD